MASASNAAWPRNIVQQFSRLERAYKKRQRKPTAKAARKLADLLADGVSPRGHGKILTVKQVAHELQMSTKSVYQHAPEWPFMHRIPGSTIYRGHADELDEWIRKLPPSHRGRG